MNIKIYFAICLLSLLSWALRAQNGNVGIGTITPDSSAMLDVSSSNKGFLVPHVKLRAIDDSTTPINRPADGLLVYHTGGNNIGKGFYYWDGHEWLGMCSCPVAVSGVEITPSSTQICLNSLVTLTARATPSNGTYTYEWTHNEVVMSGCTSASPSISLTTIGDHAFTVTVRDNNGHSATASTTVTVTANPTVTITNPSNPVCPPDETTLTPTVTGGSGSYSYSWNTGATTSTLSVSNIFQSTTYTVTVTDGNGCKGIGSTTVNVRDILTETSTFTVGGVSFTMKPVEGGTFLMGSQKNDSNGLNYDADAKDDGREAPVHQVTLSNYAIGETEVTQALWQAVMGNWPQEEPTDANGKGDNYPVYQVSWNHIMAENTGFLAKLNHALEGQLCGTKFVLPTEAQWEFAAAGGKQGYRDDGSRKNKYSGTNDVNQLSNYAWYNSNTTHIVAQKTDNELGLYDMSGNVFEWCSDFYASYSSEAQTDPVGPGSAYKSRHVYRGGSWGSGYTAVSSRVAYRANTEPVEVAYDRGFRLALVQNLPSN